MTGIEDAYADMSTPPPGAKNSTNYVVLHNPDGLNTYLVERRAEIVIPLLIAIQRRLAMSKKAHTPLSAKVWKEAGSPPKNRRVSILTQLRRMPDLVTIKEDRHFTFRYRVEKGPAWLQIEKATFAEVKVEEEESEEED